MLRYFASFGVVAFGLSCVVACGGSVVFSEDGEGGSGASASTSTSSPGTTKATKAGTTTPASSSSTVLTPCQAFCQGIGGQCHGDQCLAACEAAYVAGCEAQADALINCFALHYNSECLIPGDQCLGQEVAYNDCLTTHPPCDTFECVEDVEYCYCSGECLGSPHSQECYWTGDVVQCDCYGDFGVVGSCNQESLSCELDTGCCKELLFEG